jgi:enoyl-CoA hydratase/carnithine racemase
MDLKTIKLERREVIATVLLSRPHRRNAWTGRMHTEYRHVLQELDADPTVRVIVVTGDPEGKAFCAGADTAALEGHSDKGRYDSGTKDDIARPGFGVREEFDATFAYHFGISKPIIAAINGAAAGIGVVMAAFADLRFAAKGAKFTTAHGRFNFPAEFGLSWVLPRIIGLTHANDLLLSSRVFLAEEAMEMGFLNKCLPSDELMPAVYDYAAMLAKGAAPGSLRETKWQVYTDQHRDVGTAVAEAERLLEEMVKHPDYKEGIKAWMEKRPAKWTG